MNNTHKLVATLALSASFAAGTATAGSITEPVWSFANVSINHLDWSTGTEQRTGNNGNRKEDFNYLEVEGGAGYNWGEIYGFYDIENPGRKRENEDGKEKRIATKGTMHYYLGDSLFSLYAQVYHFNSKPFYETNTVVGLGYRYSNGSGFWIKPWIGGHYVDSDNGYSGTNGIMAGWVLGYNFKAMDQDFMITNWHETEFLRASKYKRVNGNLGMNGAVALWWNASQHISAGVQYRYANKKLGFDGNNNAMIYTLKYNF
ncbi:outer membrane protein OmpK [Sansalvadorimonas verongulae]|uniref:outer membrane protein OmpK n=1 Tax=Sansalvadorimonas verongulae TaxID=2172824 RepID=UPI0012BD6766|nr:outer membrane protein OmpK [Sansalvadorimonas verongulae]MTI14198.1 ion channel protein Tsx [Sansalvadorimonas verongulae]